MRGSSGGRPLLAAFDLLGRRWALRVVWELRDGALGARELRARCDDVSPSVLYDRLRELVEAGLVEREARLYKLSEIGAALESALRPLAGWAEDWSAASGH